MKPAIAGQNRGVPGFKFLTVLMQQLCRVCIFSQKTACLCLSYKLLQKVSAFTFIKNLMIGLQRNNYYRLSRLH